MYVEDNPANISLLQRIARMGGHQVINYTNGEVALDHFAQDDPDLVLMDLQLEGRISGLEVVKTLRERGFKTPIVAVTAYAMVGDRERCIEAGCNSYLSKPLPVAELVELVKTYEQKTAAKQQPPQAQPTAQAEVKPAAKPEAKPDTKSDATPEAKPDAKPGVKPETQAQNTDTPKPSAVAPSDAPTEPSVEIHQAADQTTPDNTAPRLGV